MTRVLVDTSAWIDYLRTGISPVSDQLDELLQEDRVVLCGVVEMELLWGVRYHERKRLAALLESLDYVETTREDYSAAGRLLGSLREKGITIPSTDGLIAALCLRNKLNLLTMDAHYKHISSLDFL